VNSDRKSINRKSKDGAPGKYKKNMFRNFFCQKLTNLSNKNQNFEKTENLKKN
jgi:hypothetical protein